MLMYMRSITRLRTINALAVRKELGSVLDALAKGGAPVLVTRDREPVAALVPMAVFRQRFVDYLAKDALDRAMADLEALQTAGRGQDSLEELRRLREG
jgi:antitoxin (DNA-binding transcriptional repressor) of toxin-antitoxin stability system